MTVSCRNDTGFIITCTESSWFFLLIVLLSLTGESKEESILPWDGSGDAVQSASGRKLHTCTEEAFSYTRHLRPCAAACIQKVSAQYHHCLMKLCSVKILFWVVRHKPVLSVQSLISCRFLKLDTYDPNKQKIFFMCVAKH